jgi:ABC-type glycerol-3-phosphate transport system substrate-binding protein
MKPFIGPAAALALGVLAYTGVSAAGAADKPYDGVTLNLASQNDQFAAVLASIAPEFEAQTGAKVNVDILSYPELLTKITADYVGHTKGYDLATVDIVWSLGATRASRSHSPSPATPTCWPTARISTKPPTSSLPRRWRTLSPTRSS